MKNLDSLLQQLLGNFYSPALAAACKILLVVVAAYLAVKLGGFLITRLFARRKFMKDDKKIVTLASMTTSVLKYVIYIAAAVIILSDVLGLTSVLAAAGVGGVAIGLGLQTLIKDVVSGFFIIVEDQFSVGDDISVEGFDGRVEELGFRLTKLRGSNGDLYIIPNGEIRKITNHSRSRGTCTG